MKNNVNTTEIGEYQKLIYNAEDLFNLERFDEALAILDKIPKGCEEYSTALLMKSIILRIMGDDERSFEAYQQSFNDKFELDGFDDKKLGMNDSHWVFLFGFGIFLLFRDYHKAINYFDLSLRLNPNQSDVLYFKAASLAHLGKFKKAVKVIDRAIKITPDNSHYWNDKGLFLTQLNHVKKAHLAFDKSIEIEDTCDAWANKGVLYCKYDDFDNAIYCFDKAISIDANDIYSIVCKASIYSELEDFESADKYFKMAERINSQDVMYLSELGKHYLNQSQFEKSIEYLDESLKLDSELSLSWMYKSIALSELGRDDESEFCFNKAVGLDPNSLKVFDEVVVIED